MPCEVLSIMGFQIGAESQLYKSILRTKQNYYGERGGTLLDKDSRDFHRSEAENGVEPISNTVIQNLCTTDSTLYQWGGNAVPVQMSASLARATMAMHDEHWMKQDSQRIWDKLQIHEQANAQGVQLDNSIPLSGGVTLDADKMIEAGRSKPSVTNEVESNTKQAGSFENSLSEAKKAQLTVHSMQTEKMLEKQNTLAELSKQTHVTKRQTRNLHRQRSLLDQH